MFHSMRIRTAWESAKLQLSRLNDEWSPTGETFSHDAGMNLRLAVWDRNSYLSSLMPLQYAHIHMIRAYAAWAEDRDMTGYDRWNAALAAAQNTLLSLEDMLSNSDRVQYNRASKERLSKLF